ncbi:MAG TPA: cytochrome c oxidase assembly factor Coa1 family protein [Verrucomicrobiae bacterium]|nr:cytochrome c oxidase assembly factor Coa1 family protein [Verrucomicrobiae bacterium]
MDRRVVWIVLGIAGGFVLLLAAGIASLVLGVLGLVDKSPSHRCGLALVQRSAQAQRLLGSPIVQDGLTTGSTGIDNGVNEEKTTFTVSGPLGKATVESKGVRSDLDSHLQVRIGRDGRSVTIYSGPFDCPELHAARH